MNLASAKAQRPPGLKGLPLFGNLLDVSRDILGYYEEWSRQLPSDGTATSKDTYHGSHIFLSAAGRASVSAIDSH